MTASFLQIAATFVTNYWVTILAGLLVLLLYRHCTAPFTSFTKRGIPGPAPIPYFGNSLQFPFRAQEVPRCYKELYDKHGKVLGIYYYLKPYLMVADPDMIKEILVDEFSKFHDRKYKVPDPYNRILANARGQKWEDLHSTLSPIFSASKIRKMMPLMDEVLNTFLDKIDGITKTGEIVDFYRWVQRVTTEILLSTVLAAPEGFETERFIEEHEAVQAPSLFLEMLMMLPYGSLLVSLQRVANPYEKIWARAEDVIAERTNASRQNNEHRNDLIQLMLDARQETGGERLDYKDIIAQSSLFFAMAYSACSSILAFVCYHLAVDTHVQHKLNEEIDRLWPKDEELPAYDIVQKMDYLDTIINEALRMYPPTIMLQRDCNESCTIKGVDILNGESLMIPVFTLHYDPEMWPEPEKFDPERFTEAEKAKRHPFAFMTWGQGPRGCIGSLFGMLVMKLTLVKLLRKCKLERTEKTVVPMGYEVVFGPHIVCPKGKLMLRLSQRI